MDDHSRRLAAYAADFRFEDIPPEVLLRARNTIADGIGAMIYGYELPWSQIVVRYAMATGQGGTSRILGLGGPAVCPPQAALANGALAHAFEMDGATKPSYGVHPCATIFPAILAIAQSRGGSGKTALAAFVAATEITCRIGRATLKSQEERGFHGPGTTCPFGAAIGAAKMLGLGADEMTNALGIAASLASGVVQFSRAGTGAMVKRLHFGRANESGVMAASLAADGYTGPHDGIEGELGFLAAYCNEYDIGELTRTLGQSFDTMTIYMKRFACHGAAQIPLQALLDLQAAHAFSGDEVAGIAVSASADRVARHNILAPAEPMLAQYSVPFSLALGCYRDPRDPRAFDQSAIDDPKIRDLTRRVRFFVSDDPAEDHSKGNTVTVTLKDGRSLRRQAFSFTGTPQMPPSQADVQEKFATLTRHCGAEASAELFERIQTLEQQPDLDWLRL